MKRITIIFIVSTIILVILTSCSSKTSNQTKETFSTEESTQVQSEDNIEEDIIEKETIFVVEETKTTTEWWWEGEKISPNNLKVDGPSGIETCFNENIEEILDNMWNNGFIGEYWIREDGVKMFGKYIICKANPNNKSLGTIIPTTIGIAIVCDVNTEENVCIAVTW